MKDEFRMIGVFGEREMELAAIKIVDFYKGKRELPPRPPDKSIFKDELEATGFAHLIMYGWLNKNGIPKESFWKRIKERDSEQNRPDVKADR